MKIDRGFVADIDSEPVHATVIRSVIDLAHGLGMQVVAEGVETRAQRALLTGYGCDLAQGYLFSRPLEAAAMGGWLQEVNIQNA